MSRTGGNLNNGTNLIHRRHVVIALSLILILAMGVYFALRVTASPETVWFSVSARTNIIDFDVESRPGQPVVFRLPAASLIYEDPDLDFETAARALAGPVSLAIEGQAHLLLRSSRPGAMSIRAESLPGAGRSAFRVHDETGLVHNTDDAVDLIFDCTSLDCSQTSGIRMLLNARRMTLGETPIEWTEPDGPGQVPFDQMGLESGTIRAFLKAFVYKTRFQLSETSVSAGDVLVLPGEDPIVGTIDFHSTGAERGRLSVVAHARGKAVGVQRFGGGYSFGVSKYTAISQQPFGQTVWLALVSIIIVLGFWVALSEMIANMLGIRHLRSAAPTPEAASAKEPDT